MYAELIILMAAVDAYNEGPPGGRTTSQKIRFSTEEGGIYGPGASGATPGEEVGGMGSITTEDLVQYLQYNSDRGDPTSQYSLAQLYYHGSSAIPQNFELAFRYFRAAAMQLPTSYTGMQPLPSSVHHMASAAAHVGQMYRRGEGVPEDPKTALKWFYRAAEYDDPTALNGLGKLHQEGVAVEKVNSVLAVNSFYGRMRKRRTSSF